MIKSILFDVGGVIVAPAILQVDNELALRLGVDPIILKKETIKYQDDLLTGKINFEQCYESLLPQIGIFDAKPFDVAKQRMDLVAELSYDLNFDLIELKDRLRSHGIRVVVASNCELDMIPIGHSYGMYEGYDQLYLSAEMGLNKPNSSYFQHIIDAEKIKPEEALILDDLMENVHGASQLGINSILYKWKMDLTSEFAKYDLKI